MKRHPRLTATLTFAAAISAASLPACGHTDLTVTTYTSDAGFAVNSHLVAGQTDAVLIDGQFFKADAQKVAQMVKDSGKTLKLIVLTHAHPDHYAGIDEILKVFPGVPVQSTPEVVADFNAKGPGTLQGLQQSFPGQVADKLATITALPGDTIDIEGNTLQVVKIPEGESVTSLAIYATRQKLLFSGDNLYNNAYLWVAECKTAAWSTNIDTLRGLGEIAQVYPGHGPAPGTSSVLDADQAYLRDVTPILKSAASSDDAIAQIKAKYPTYTGTNLLGYSTPTYFMSCR